MLGILYEPGDVIVSFDKDMLTLPGLHYRNGEVVEVSLEEADRAFFTQALTGDAADNYPGCPTVGPKTAEKALAHWSTERDLWREVVNLWMLKGGCNTREVAERLALQQARCARILRAGEYDMTKSAPVLWCPPVS